LLVGRAEAARRAMETKRKSPILVDDKAVKVTGGFIKTAQLQDEYYVSIEDPVPFIAKLRSFGPNADIFTFAQEINDRTPKYKFHQEWDSKAVLPLTTYDHWMNKQINFKPRNKIRKALKNGVETRMIEFTDDLVKGIMDIYDETPVRQGKRNRHYGKDFDTLKREHQTFLERSDFIGAFYKNKLIGFVKVTHAKNYSVLMNIVARISERDKAPANALIAKTVEVCTARNSTCLMYGIWGRKGLNDFKEASGFERVEVPRYFVPLTLKGRLALKLTLHRTVKDHVPEKYIALASDLRARWNGFRYKNHGGQPVGAAAR
jgi:hypothetical protein